MFPIPTWEQLEAATKAHGVDAGDRLLADGFKKLRLQLGGTMGFRDRGGRDQKPKDSKYLRLTGLWQSKKNDALWTGKIRNQDLGVLLDKVEEADKAHADVVVFLWENKEKNGPKDPEFTVQISVSEDVENSRRGSGGSSRDRGSSRRSTRDRDEEKEDEKDEEKEEEQEEEADEEKEEEEKPSRRSKAKEKEAPRTRSGAGKKDKNDW